ncbi:MAG: glutamate-5-semialdehyde dehydrogenase [Actinomycetota bacterium]|nr:glutamate-5-semialdehyde dehydrogenase [Actinomycetota bacterium]
MATTVTSVAQICVAAKRASRTLAQLDSTARNAALRGVAAALECRTPEILEANARDLDAGRDADLTPALLDRLALDERRVAGIAQQVRDIAALPDPVGEVIDGRRLANGLNVRKVRVPLGVIAVVYEARPNVTIDAAALCLKSGNAVVLRGSSMAMYSNAILAGVAVDAVLEAGLPDGSMNLVAGGGHDELEQLATQAGLVDLIIPRGGEGLKAALKEVATVPVMYAASGNCHVFVEATADLQAALAITLNAKLQRPSTCNAVETLLVDRALAGEFLPLALRALADENVELRGDETVREIAGDLSVLPATEDDWATEYHALTLAVGVVDGTEDAIEHINRYGSAHSDAIVTRDTVAARAFQLGVDSACVYVNASTRFTDGGEFGMGAEIGNSTQRLHARGPIGLRELCTYKYLVDGSGHIRG